MIHCHPNIFWGYFPIIVKYMDEKALLNASSISKGVNACVSANIFWEKHLYANSCRWNLIEGGAKLHYFEHIRVYHRFFSKALKIELPKNFIEVREVVELKLMKGKEDRASQLTDFFSSEMKRFIRAKNDKIKFACDQNMQMLLKEGAEIKFKKRISLMEKAVVNACSLKTIEMMFDRGGECDPSYICDAIILNTRKKQIGQSSLILAQRIPRIDLKNQSRFCTILQAKASDRTVECLAAKVEHVSVDTLFCALQNKYHPKILEILYRNFSPRTKKKDLNLICSGIGEEEVNKAIMAGFSDEIIGMIIDEIPVLNVNLIEIMDLQEKISPTITCKLIEKIGPKDISSPIIKLALSKGCSEEFFEKILVGTPKFSADTIEEAMKKEYSERIITLLAANVKAYDYITQKTFLTAIQKKYSGDTIRLLMDIIAPHEWIKLDVIVAAKNAGYENGIITQLERWHLL